MSAHDHVARYHWATAFNAMLDGKYTKMHSHAREAMVHELTAMHPNDVAFPPRVRSDRARQGSLVPDDEARYHRACVIESIRKHEENSR